MKNKEWQRMALNRARVVNQQTNQSGNLVQWSKGDTCKVFTHYDRIGAISLPNFERWPKSDTQLEVNQTLIIQ